MQEKGKVCISLFLNLKYFLVSVRWITKNQHEGQIVSIESTLQEIPPPEFVLTKPGIHWSEEEKKVYKEYEKKAKDLSEEKEKYKKVLKSMQSHFCFPVIGMID